ncbi:MAG: L-serine ammonia-lyase, iron-sulfur-dependent, subunit alpha [Acholeplasmatales bacterium]|jgi:L-serine dehydratase|nr:L-serine ammonia-lyase, iron-sulfur-dependent, subunit alpha [Acholeplasmatales bacterium]
MESIRNIYKIGYGPSSSHTIGPSKACLYVKQKYLNATSFEVILFNSLSLTGLGHDTLTTILRIIPNCQITTKVDKSKHPNYLIIKSFLNDQLLGLDEFESVGGGKLKINGVIESSGQETYPHQTFTEIKNYCLENHLDLYEYIKKFESDLTFIEPIFQTMLNSVKNGLSKEGFLPGKLLVQRRAKEMYHTFMKNDSRRGLISAYAFSASEENAAGGLIVTAPTCGACGVIPSLVYHAYHNKKLKKSLILKSLLVAGLIGKIIEVNASISGAVAGCQAEIGSATAMASAMLCYIDNDSIEVTECASEIAIEHCLGLTCDPIMGYVQIPCIERNVFASLRAIDCANIAKGIVGQRKISLDMIIKTMYQTGLDMMSKYKETSKGGLAKAYLEKIKNDK